MDAKGIGLEAVVREKYENGKIRTDSDVIELAEEYGTGYRQISRILDRLKTEGTPCEGCGHIGERFCGNYDSICRRCSKVVKTKDCFEPEDIGADT